MNLKQLVGLVLIEQQKKTKRAESALKTRLQSLLQASQMKQGSVR